MIVVELCDVCCVSAFLTSCGSGLRGIFSGEKSSTPQVSYFDIPINLYVDNSIDFGLR